MDRYDPDEVYTLMQLLMDLGWMYCSSVLVAVVVLTLVVLADSVDFAVVVVVAAVVLSVAANFVVVAADSVDSVVAAVTEVVVVGLS